MKNISFFLLFISFLFITHTHALSANPDFYTILPRTDKDTFISYNFASGTSFSVRENDLSLNQRQSDKKITTSLFFQKASRPIDPFLASRGFLLLRDNISRDFFNWLSFLESFGIKTAEISQAACTHRYALFESSENTKWDERIKKTTNDLFLESSIIHHIIKKESNYNERAASSADARGLMQLLPNVAADILKTRNSLGSNIEIDKQILAIQNSRSSEIYKQYKISTLNIYRTIPFSLSDFFSASKETQKRILAVCLDHGEINILLGSVHFALYKAKIDYLKAAGEIEQEINSYLATQMAYNCGINRFLKTVKKTKWKNIFSQNGLPFETKDYAFKAIKDRTEYYLKKQTPFRVHPEEHTHYRMCLEALNTSREMAAIHKDLNRLLPALSIKMRALIDSSLKDQRISKREIIRLISIFDKMPSWPLIKDVRCYLFNLSKI